MVSPVLQEAPIVALATPPGHSALAVIRLTGAGVIALVNRVFRGKDLTQQPTHTLHVGAIYAADVLLDEVIVALFKAPRSFTREEGVEISCHGSPFIVRQIIQQLIEEGARLAQPGEFTKRAFLNGRFDLVQAEAVADVIAADSALAHRTALHQMRGGFSSQLNQLRGQLVQLVALLELELDFSEEDVAFADREALQHLLQAILMPIEQLLENFALGNVIKEGIPIVIAGPPNAGKSTLLNALLQEDKALVSPIPGTTRDVIEGEIQLAGIRFRLIDTAGLRDQTQDVIELMGIAKTKEQLGKASLVVYLVDLATDEASIQAQLGLLQACPVPCIRVGNKLDAASPAVVARLQPLDFILISAGQKQHLDVLQNRILAWVQAHTPPVDALVVNVRHYEQLSHCKAALEEVLSGLTHLLSQELLVADLRKAIHSLGAITGEITTEDVLDTIFAKFCIGK